MLITKEQQEALIDKYIKEKHNQDEYIGFIDGLNAMLELISKIEPRRIDKHNEISSTYHQGINDSIKTIESILDYKSNTQWGSALRCAVNQLESLKKENNGCLNNKLSNDNFLNDFLASTNTEINVQFLKNDYHFAGDKEKRDIYKVTIKRGQRKFSFDFGNSIANSGKYKGHKHLCLNNFGKYLFTEDEIKEIGKKNVFSIKYNEIKLNPDFKEPTAYDVLACLQKYNVGTFEDFCSEFGYDEDSKTADKIYTAVCKEFDNVCKIWTDEEIELLREIN